MNQEKEGGGRPAGNGEKNADTFRERLVAFLEERGLKTNHPLVEIRIADVTTWWRLVLDLQTAIWTPGAAAPKAPPDGQKQPPAGWKPDPAVDALAKAWERLRKAIGEIENMCGQTEQPARMGLGSEMKPLIEQTRGVLESALEFERKRRERAATKRKDRDTQEMPQRSATSIDPDAQDNTE